MPIVGLHSESLLLKLKMYKQESSLSADGSNTSEPERGSIPVSTTRHMLEDWCIRTQQMKKVINNAGES